MNYAKTGDFLNHEAVFLTVLWYFNHSSLLIKQDFNHQ